MATTTAAATAAASKETTKQRGPNPTTDYKRHFNKTKEKFDTVTAEQSSRRSELSRASLKQLKLQEELDFLIDAIAGEQLQRQQLQEQISGNQSPSASYHAHQHHHQESRGQAVYDLTQEDEEQMLRRKGRPMSFAEEVKPEVAGAGLSPAKRPRPPSLDPPDEGGEPLHPSTSTSEVSMGHVKRPRND